MSTLVKAEVKAYMRCVFSNIKGTYMSTQLKADVRI